ncbi:MAG: LAGLIDADG family homing endonuclease [Candidatus Diapherotrites archaeon]
MEDKEVVKKLVEAGQDILQQIEAGRNPSYELPVRSLNNIYFDKKSQTIKLGDKMSQRQFLNIAHTRKFMQTLLVASEIRKVIEEKATISIRDLYYALKHTIEGTQENTFEDQSESICPDETVLVRLNGKLKLVSADEVVRFAEKNGTVEVDEPERKIISINNISVCGFDSQQKIAEHKTDYIIVHPPNEAVKIKTSSGRAVKVTKSHSLFTVREGFPVEIKTSELKKGGYIAIPRRISIKENTEPINIIYSLIENAPEEIIEKIYLKSDKETINLTINRIGKERVKEYILKNKFKNNPPTVKANWEHWKTLPLKLIKETNPQIEDLMPKIRISGKGSQHKYKCTIEKKRGLGIVLGALLSEGSLSIIERKRKEFRVSINNKSIEYLQEFKQAFEEIFGGCSSKKLLKCKDGTYRLNVGYDSLSHILQYGVGLKFEKAWDKEIPPLLLDSPKECIQAFIYSFRREDGSKGPRFEIRFHTTSKKLVDGITFLLLRLGLFANIYEYKRTLPKHNAFEVRVGNRDYSGELSKITGDYNDSFEKTTMTSSDKISGIGNLIKKARKGIALGEKTHKEMNFSRIEKSEKVSRNMVRKIISTLGNANNEYVQQLQLILESDIYWDKIKSIEKAEVPEYTMDFCVRPIQNFIGGTGLLLLHNSDPCIEDIEASLNLLREELHLAASSKGVIAGDLKIKDGKDTIDLTKMGSGGWGVPSNVEPEKIEIKDLSAEYVLFIEKDAVWKRFNEDRFWQKNKCIIITGRGQPSRAERRLVQRLNREFKLPVFALMDADPWGMYIYSVIKQGSISLSYSEEKLATPETKYIGLTVKDVETFKIPKEVTIKLNKLDEKRLNEMKGYEWFRKKEWQEEFARMKDKAIKLELEALSKKGIRFITEDYLPQKIKSKDFLP